jgi:hypothetical protein
MTTQENKKDKKQENIGTLKRDEAAKSAFRHTSGSYGDRARASARAFASGNRWAEENARAVGHW